MVLWDKIILRGEKAVIDYQDINGKYPFFDDGTGLRWVEHMCDICYANLYICIEVTGMYH